MPDQPPGHEAHGEQPPDGPVDGRSGSVESPIWERDFPYTSAGEEAVTRRAFARYLVAGSGALAVSSFGAAGWASLRSLNTGSPQELAEASSLGEGESLLFGYPEADDPAVLVRLRNGEFHAYSQKCTHLGCVVYWEDEHEEFVCPCHEGVFDARTGRPIAGPPERPLRRVRLEVRAESVWLLGMEE